jgi:putative FmdB family regulatory protein
MPTYDYVCEACPHEFELFQQMSAPVETVCPECGKESLRRLVGTGGGILFKGSGFYETDYRSAAYKKAADSEKKSSASPKGEKKDAKSGGDGGSKAGSGSEGSGGSAKKDSGGSTGASSSGSGTSSD